MNEDNIVDIEQPDEPSENGAEIGESDIENSNTEIVLGADALEELFTEENPIPVTIVEEKEEEQQLEVFALSGSYSGTISDTYLDYLEGIVQKLPYNDHYVIWRSGQYAYTLAYGENIKLDGSRFTGECDVVNLYRDDSSYNNNWYVEYDTDTLSLNTGSLYVYSDLGLYPTVERGFSDIEAKTILFAVGFFRCFSNV